MSDSTEVVKKGSSSPSFNFILRMFTRSSGEMSAGKFEFLMVIPSVIVMVLISIIPIFVLIILSFFKAQFAMSPKYVGLMNFFFILKQDPAFWNSIQKSFIYTFGTVSVSFVIAMSVALALNHKAIRFVTFFRTMTLLPWAMPIIVSAFMWYMLFDFHGVLNDVLLRLGLISQSIVFLGEKTEAMFSVVLTDIWIRTPLMIVILLAALQTIPEDLVEAAMIDGAGPVQRFRHVTIPVIKPALYFVLLINSIFAFRTFEIGQVLTRGGPGGATHLLVIYTWETLTTFFQIGRAASLSIIMFLVVGGFVVFWSLVFRSTLKKEA